MRVAYEYQVKTQNLLYYSLSHNLPYWFGICFLRGYPSSEARCLLSTRKARTADGIMSR